MLLEILTFNVMNGWGTPFPPGGVAGSKVKRHVRGPTLSLSGMKEQRPLWHWRHLLAMQETAHENHRRRREGFLKPRGAPPAHQPPSLRWDSCRMCVVGESPLRDCDVSSGCGALTHVQQLGAPKVDAWTTEAGAGQAGGVPILPWNSDSPLPPRSPPAGAAGPLF